MTDQREISKKLYEQTLRLRLIESEIAIQYSNWQMRCPVHLSVGQEAVSAAFSILATAKDYAVSTHRGHAHYLAKGGNLKSMIAEIYGKVDGCSKGRGGSMHLIDTKVNFMGTSAIVGNSIPIGVGLAYDLWLKKARNFSFIFVGDGAIEEGVFAESAAFAVLHNLPVVFMCENNNYSVYTKLETRQQSREFISNLSRGLGLKYYYANGNNAIEAFTVLRQALSEYHGNFQPIFIEFKTARHLEHCGPNSDNELGYRSAAEIEDLTKQDPIRFLENHLRALDSIDFDSYKEFITAAISREIAEAFEFAQLSPFPKFRELWG